MRLTRDILPFTFFFFAAMPFAQRRAAQSVMPMSILRYRHARFA